MRKIFNYVISDFVNLFLPLSYRSQIIIDYITSLLNLESFRNLYVNIKYNSSFTSDSNTILSLPFVFTNIEPLDIVIINGDINTVVTNITTIDNINNTITVNNNTNAYGTIIIIKQNHYYKSKILAQITGQKKVLESYLRSYYNEEQIYIIINTVDTFSKFFYKISENNKINFIYKLSENNPLYLYKQNEFNNLFDFIVRVPLTFENTNKQLLLIKIIDAYKTYNTKYKIEYV